MTREEAIDILRSYLMFDKSNMQIDIALNMAIEALSADTVSREVYNAMAKHAKALENLSIEDRVRIMYDAVEDIHNIRIINEVVRCKDCKWRKINRKSGTLNCGHEYGMITAKDDNFCNYGEKENE